MRITVNRTQLVAALKTVLPAIPRSTHLTALTGVRIEATDDGITVTASNLDKTITATGVETTATTTDEPGVAVVNAHRFARIIGVMPGTEVLLETRETVLDISSGNTAASVPVIPVDTYPDVPRPSADAEWHALKASDLDAVRRVIHAASTDTTRGLLCGVSLEGRMAKATDSYRLAQCALNVELPDDLPSGLVVDAQTLRNALDAADDTLWLAVSGRHVHLATDHITWTSLPVIGDNEESYPKFDRLIRDTSKFAVTVNAEALRTALTRMDAVGSDEGDGIVTVLWFDEDQIRVERSAQDVGEIEDLVPCIATPGTPPVGVRSEFLADALANVTSDEVTIGVETSLKPVVVADGDWLGLVMPIRSARIP